MAEHPGEDGEASPGHPGVSGWLCASRPFLAKYGCTPGPSRTGPRHPVFLPAGRQSASPVAGGTPCICWLLSPGTVAGAGRCPLPELPPCEPACPPRACLSIQAARDVPPRPRATLLSPELHARLPLGSILGRVCLGGGASQGPPHSPREGIPYVPPGLPGRPPCNPLGPKLQHTLSRLEQGSPAQRSTEAPGTDRSGTPGAHVREVTRARKSAARAGGQPACPGTHRCSQSRAGAGPHPDLGSGRGARSAPSTCWPLGTGALPGGAGAPSRKAAHKKTTTDPTLFPTGSELFRGQARRGVLSRPGRPDPAQLGAASSQEFGTRTYVPRWPMAGVRACTLR